MQGRGANGKYKRSDMRIRKGEKERKCRSKNLRKNERTGVKRKEERRNRTINRRKRGK